MSVVVNDKATRDAIEAYTLKNTFPDIIVFIEDKDGDWVIGEECLVDPKYSKELLITSELSRVPIKAPNPKDVAIYVKPITDGTEEITP